MSEVVSPRKIAAPAVVDRRGDTAETTEAAAMRAELAQHYDDDLPQLASLWINSERSAHTRRSYARVFGQWRSSAARSTCTRSSRRPHVEAYMRRLEADGRPATSVAHALSVASSFYRYAISLEVTDSNPLKDLDRPRVDPDYSGTEGLTRDQTARLLEVARSYSARAYAIVLTLYTLGLRVDGALSADVTALGYDRGHRILTVTAKGGTTMKLPLPPVTVDAIESYLNGPHRRPAVHHQQRRPTPRTRSVEAATPPRPPSRPPPSRRHPPPCRAPWLHYRRHWRTSASSR